MLETYKGMAAIDAGRAGTMSSRSTRSSPCRCSRRGRPSARVRSPVRCAADGQADDQGCAWLPGVWVCHRHCAPPAGPGPLSSSICRTVRMSNRLDGNPSSRFGGCDRSVTKSRLFLVAGVHSLTLRAREEPNKSPAVASMSNVAPRRANMCVRRCATTSGAEDGVRGKIAEINPIMCCCAQSSACKTLDADDLVKKTLLRAILRVDSFRPGPIYKRSCLQSCACATVLRGGSRGARLKETGGVVFATRCDAVREACNALTSITVHARCGASRDGALTETRCPPSYRSGSGQYLSADLTGDYDENLTR